MMKRASLVLLGLFTASVLVFVACDDEPTQQEANEQFCDDTAEFIASLRVIRDLDPESTIEEIQEARDRAVDAHEDMVASAEGVVDARLDDLQTAWADLQSAVQGLDDDATLEQALDDVDDELDEASSEAAQVLNDVDCSGVGSEGDSEE